MSDRYIKAILTVIALELLWIGAKDIGTPASAQTATVQQTAPTSVIIRGIDIINPAPNGADPARSALPVYARAAVPVYSSQTLKVDADRPLAIIGAAPLKIEADKPLPVEAPKPLRVEIPYTPGKTPGE
jgi:hypothetical protein